MRNLVAVLLMCAALFVASWGISGSVRFAAAFGGVSMFIVAAIGLYDPDEES